MKNYIVRSKGKLFAFYYAVGSGVFYRVFENGKWKERELLTPSCSGIYSVSIGENGDIYAFVHENNGDIKLFSVKERKNKTIIKNQSPIVRQILMDALISQSGMCLFYNSSDSEMKTQFLTKQYVNIDNFFETGLSGDSFWNRSSPSRIDRIANLPGGIFDKRNVSSDHCVIFYMTKARETTIGYREFTNERTGGFHPFYTTAHTLHDYSVLVTGDTIHCLLLLKNMFSSQLVYRKKTESGMSRPIIIWEGQRFGECSLCIVKNDLYASFLSGETLYSCKSYDMGNTFERPAKYMNKLCRTLGKSVYLTEGNEMNESDYYCSELYIDAENPHDIQILPDLYENFY